MSSKGPKTVYFIRPIGMDGPVKIGCSQSPDNRLSTLETWSPFPLEIVARIDGDFILERRLHGYFRDSHQRREWFHASQKMNETIAAINAGTFDINGLPDPVGVSSYIAGLKRARTPEECLKVSYSLRIRYMERRSGFEFSANRREASDVVQNGKTAQAEAFLAAPHIHGYAPDNPWAAKKRAAWFALIDVSPASREQPSEQAA